ncbi:hypothetical protein C0989_003398 [Termitomyces sp. Mn162]|nr:hypothetical protein C0989_003398 [Termitomyces sp. Mn162]
MASTYNTYNLLFTDGDFDLALPNQTYRVHKAILAEKSQVFADMFLIAQPESAVPVIQLEDEQETFALFLHALYNHDLDSYIPQYQRNTTKLIARTLDVSNKYGVAANPMLDKFTPYINRDWPDTLAGWDAVEEYADQLRKRLEEAKEDPGGNDQLPEPASAIRFAYLYAPSESTMEEIPKYLPAAFYHLARLPPEADVDATARGFWDVEGGRSAIFSLLRHQDMMCLYNGIYNIRNTAAEIAFKDFQEAAQGDEAAESEKTAMLEWWKLFAIQRLVGPNELLDPLAELKRLVDLLGEGSQLQEPESIVLRERAGAAYRKRMQKWLQKQREDIWKDLPRKFSLFEFFYYS